LGKKTNQLNYQRKLEVKSKERLTFGYFAISPARRFGADPSCVKLSGPIKIGNLYLATA